MSKNLSTTTEGLRDYGRQVLAVALLAVGCLFLTPAAAKADIVVFKTGRTMSVQGYKVDGDSASGKAAPVL